MRANVVELRRSPTFTLLPIQVAAVFICTSLLMETNTMEPQETRSREAEPDRRAFLATAGKFAVVVPPAMTMLLSTTMSSPAIAQSGGAIPAPTTTAPPPPTTTTTTSTIRTRSR